MLAILTAAVLAGCGGRPAPAAPTAPTGVTATPIVGGVRVEWTDTSTTERGFLIYRAAPTAPTAPVQVGAAPADAERFDDHTTEAGTRYRYLVAADGPGGTSAPTPQEGAAVAPLEGVELRIVFDGSGTVTVRDGSSERRCSQDCVLAFAPGTALQLAASGTGGQVFAGWSGACDGAGPCSLVLESPSQVGARFASNVLTVALRGDATVEARITPDEDGGGSRTCTLAPGQDCTLAYADDTIGDGLAVSIALQATEEGTAFGPFEGCSADDAPTFCIVTIGLGATRVTATATHAPLASGDAYDAREDRAAEVPAETGVLNNDRDSPGDALRAVLDAPPERGELELEGDGAFRYRPDPNVHGEDAFTYHAQDAFGNVSEPVRVVVRVRPVNDPPSFELADGPVPIKDGDGAQTIPEFAHGITAGGGGSERGQALTFELATGDVLGSLRFDAAPTLATDGTLRYTPTTGTYGSVEVTAVLLDDGGTANGGDDTSSPRRFTITVAPLVLTVSTTGGGRIDLEPPPSGGGYAYGSRVRLRAEPDEGYVFAGWGGACADTPDRRPDCTLTLTGDANVSARFSDDLLRVSLEGDTSVRATITPGDGGTGATVCGLEPGESCTASYPEDGIDVTIAIAFDEPGSHAAPFQGCTSQANGTRCVVTIGGGPAHVTATALHPPTAGADAYGWLEDDANGIPAAVGVLANDGDSPGDELSAELEATTARGALDLSQDGSFRYQPAADLNGTDSFRYRTRDAYGNVSDPVTVTLNVRAVNDPPDFELAGDPPAVQDGAGPQTVAGFARGVDPGGGADERSQALAFEVVTGTPDGSLRFDVPPTLDLDGTLRYTPTTGTYGSVEVTAALVDDGGTADGGRDRSSPRDFTITVAPLTLTVRTHGSGRVAVTPPAADGGYAYGTGLTLTAEPEAGNGFAGWSGACTGTQPTCQRTITGDLAVDATFVARHTLRVAIDGAAGAMAGGIVRSDPAGIDCPQSCEAAFEDGAKVKLLATPQLLFDFEGWSGDCGGKGSCVLTMDEDRQVTAIFASGLSFQDDAGARPSGPP